jgi:NCAIR mutase (PurE)-related protein
VTNVKDLLRQVASGAVPPEEALLQLRAAPFEDLGWAKIDTHRAVRQGTHEVIYGEGKTAGQIAGIAEAMAGVSNILITRISRQTADEVAERVALRYIPEARIGIANPKPIERLIGSIAVASGGTSDMGVCEEAAVTAETLGSKVTRLYDMGVAGLHRLLARLDVLQSARVVVAVAGMEGALASVIGGLVSCPVIAVPTSVGYGANLGGVAALLTMLNSCASGVSVVNIDNGFGAGFLAHRINVMEGCP